MVTEGELENKVKKGEKKFAGKTFLLVSPCDQGHYGTSLCGKCHYILKNSDPEDYCPECNYEFTRIKSDFSGGGSDF